MRIAVCGTHCTGKSTLVEEFLRVHPDFAHEPEPYTVLVEDYGEGFSEKPRVEDFLRQLEFNIARLHQHARGEHVIYERCPIDFLAYIDVLDQRTAEPVLESVSDAIQHLDLVVYLPLTDDLPDAEYPKLRNAVDRRLSAIFRDNEFDIVVVEAQGSTAQRLRIIEEAMSRYPDKSSNTQPGDVSHNMTS
jgi:nicotinamide riboside kinase